MAVTEGYYDDGTTSEAWAAGSPTADYAGSRLRRQAAQFEGIRQQALSLCRLRWESPAGSRFVAYLEDRTADIAASVNLLSTAAQLAEAHADALRRAEAEAIGAGMGQ
ncbi:hypothetical protein [Arthrobacter sp. H41]|uniref:hypothetical protein n=1 Tax=Arthrobacter sp. H41 TaxID=1312978 RepID=UPI00047C08DD|nr:hypothetical protein [Arthrobacter sp. H41]